MGLHSTLALVSFAFAILLLCITGLSSVCSGIVSSAAVSLRTTSAYAIGLLHGAQNALPMLAVALFLFFSWPFGLSSHWESILHQKYYFCLWLVVGIISVSLDLCTSTVNIYLLLVFNYSKWCRLAARHTFCHS